jgi:acetoin utilization deacetylase AcuC-like enzyme
MACSSPIHVVYDPFFLRHDTGGDDHPESPARLLTLIDRFNNCAFTDKIQFVPPRKDTHEWILAVHRSEYLNRFEEASLSGRSYIDHPDNQICYDSYAVAMLATGSGPAAIDCIENGEGTAFCCVRPPGHHAEQSMALGFCFLNNCAIAARYWQKRYGRKKLLIFDFDAHHGNGIQTCFEEDPDVFYISIHEHPTFSFPGTGYAEDKGIGAGTGTTLNISLPPGSKDSAVQKAIAAKIAPAVEEFKPEAIIVAAGFDGHVHDDMSGLAYSTALFGELAAWAASWAKTHCQAKILTILEGGYHLESLADGVETYLSRLNQELFKE